MKILTGMRSVSRGRLVSMMMRPKIAIICALVGVLLGCGDDFTNAQFRGTGDALPQVTRKVVQGEIGDRFLQVAELQEEEFQQKIDESTLDLLVVVDNSGSMSQEQANLSTKLNPLLKHIADSNWQIAVTTTDENDDCLRPDGLIKKGEVDTSLRFEEAIRAGTSGDASEFGLLQAVRALSMQPPYTRIAPCSNPTPWVRPDSAVAILVVSDEDNCSQAGLLSDCPGEEHRNPSFLTDYLSSIRQVGVNARVYGLIWQPGQLCAGAGNIGYTYDTVIQATGGTSGSICENDYTQTLEAISKDISVILESRFKLKTDADPTSLEVYVDGQIAEIEYKVFGDVVSFRNPPPPGSSVVIKYRPISIEGKNRFKLSKDYEGEIVVKLDGEFLEASEYTVDKKTNELVLRTAPPRNAELYIYYGEEQVVRNTFLIEPNIKVATLKIFINDVETTEFDFDNGTGIATFNEVPPEKAVIVATFAK